MIKRRNRKGSDTKNRGELAEEIEWEGRRIEGELGVRKVDKKEKKRKKRVKLGKELRP